MKLWQERLVEQRSRRGFQRPTFLIWAGLSGRASRSALVSPL